MRTRALLVLPFVVAGAAAGVVTTRGGSANGRTPAATVIVREKDFQIHLSRSRVPAGEVRLVVRNAGPDDHELIVVRSGGALPLRSDGLTVDEEALQRRTVGTLEPAGPGAVRELDVRLAPGSYEIFCNMAGHYMGGMRALLTVV